MAFSYRPVPFDDPAPINRVAPGLAVTQDLAAVARQLVSRPGLVVLDGFPSGRFQMLATAVGEIVPEWELVDVSTLYRPEAELAALLTEYLPEDRETDPELIFGRLFDRDYEAFFDPAKVAEFVRQAAAAEHSILLYGLGSAYQFLREHADAVFFLDVTPKDAALRVHGARYQCLGAPSAELGRVIRQTYFVDVEVAVRLRRDLLGQNLIDGYLLDGEAAIRAVDWPGLRHALREVGNGPLRAKPVYVEGVWGGQFIKRARGIADDCVDKVAWAFELIPTEASVLIQSGAVQVDVPFVSMMDIVGEQLVGDVLYRRFDGRFPIRFNYDDTWHSNGNMSIQVHPSDEMIQELHGDIAAQHEAYYIVLTGHGAKTYCGFKGDGRQFLELCRASEQDGSEVPYQEYIHALDSTVGRQIFLPNGTIHSSGRNQLVLELGTITSGAYTYKIYDYNRPDITGKPRPIHTKLAGRALAFDRDAAWVERNIAFPPRLAAEGPGWTDYLVGSHDDMYIETHRIEIRAGGTRRLRNATGFSVIALVDGETARIEAAGDPSRRYEAGYLDVILIPATVPEYDVTADPRHPIVIHQTVIRADRYQAWQTS